MNYRERMKEYLKEPDEYSSDWGRWGILNKEQRTLIRRVLDEMDSADEVIKHQFEEIERLNNVINELNNAYCKVITKCEEMIDNRFYMNDIAIKKYADEIKDICKYYVGEAKELKGADK